MAGGELYLADLRICEHTAKLDPTKLLKLYHANGKNRLDTGPPSSELQCNIRQSRRMWAKDIDHAWFFWTDTVNKQLDLFLRTTATLPYCWHLTQS